MADIVGRVRIDGSGVATGLNQAQSALSRWGSDVKRTIAGAFGGAAFMSAVRKTIADIDQISDTSEELDMPVEQVQALKIAAMEASDSFEKLLAILTKIQDIQIDIVKGESASALKNRGILQKHGYSAEQINTMSLMQFAQVLASKITDKTEMNQLLGPRMATKFENYRGNIINMDENLKRGMSKGVIYSKSDIDNMNATVAQAKEMWNDFWSQLMYGLSAIVVTIRDFVNWLVSLKPWWLSMDYFKSPTALIRQSSAIEEIQTPSTTNSKPLVNSEDIRGSQKTFTDSLVSVGNFLGARESAFNYAATMLDETRKQTELLKSINAKISMPATEKTPNPRDYRGFDTMGLGWGP